MVNATCEDNSAQVSWGASPVAETYHVVAVGGDGHVHAYNTTSTNCTLPELHCDQQYTVFVTAGHENCSSEASQKATLNTGTCVCVLETHRAYQRVDIHAHDTTAMLVPAV